MKIPKLKIACNNVPLKESTARDWIDKQAQEIKEAGNKVKQQAAANGGEKVSGSQSKVQKDWMEAFSQFAKLTDLVEQGEMQPNRT